MAKIKVIIKRPDEQYGHVCSISTSLENLQRTVGGYVEEIKVGNFIILCNEEGKLLNLEPNMKLGDTFLVGTIIVIGGDGDDYSAVPITFSKWKEFVDLQNK